MKILPTTNNIQVAAKATASLNVIFSKKVLVSVEIKIAGF